MDGPIVYEAPDSRDAMTTRITGVPLADRSGEPSRVTSAGLQCRTPAE
jgi:hypothetical protein